MKNESQFSSLIYELFLMRFRFQYYRFHDTISSIDTLCQEFNVSAQTVKAVLRRLRSEGYIDMHNGRPTRVLFRQNHTDFLDTVHNFYSARVHAFPDLCQSARMVLIPLIMEGFRRLDEEEFAGLTRLINQAGVDDVLNFFSCVLQKSKNPLALNLYWEVSMYMGLLYFGEQPGNGIFYKTAICEDLEEIILLGKTGQWETLRGALIRFHKNSTELALERIRLEIPAAKKEAQIPFSWRIYYGRPQLCYSLAIHIMHEIYIGDYRDAECLPSYEKMAAKYKVSVSTMRRTVSMLNQIGITESENGVGTHIRAAVGTGGLPYFTSPVIRRSLALFFQSFELILCSCESAARITFLALTAEQKASLIFRLEENLRSGRCEFTLWHLLICIAVHCPLSGIREMYSKLYGLFLWGYPLNASPGETPAFDEDVTQFTAFMIKSLQNEDFDRCGAQMFETVTQMFPRTEKYLSSHGIQPDELRLPPSVPS